MEGVVTTILLLNLKFIIHKFCCMSHGHTCTYLQCRYS